MTTTKKAKSMYAVIAPAGHGNTIHGPMEYARAKDFAGGHFPRTSIDNTGTVVSWSLLTQAQRDSAEQVK